jgi:hypothetical protein
MLPFALKIGGFLWCASCWWKTRNKGGWCHAAFLLVTGTPTWAEGPHLLRPRQPHKGSKIQGHINTPPNKKARPLFKVAGLLFFIPCIARRPTNLVPFTGRAGCWWKTPNNGVGAAMRRYCFLGERWQWAQPKTTENLFFYVIEIGGGG